VNCNHTGTAGVGDGEPEGIDCGAAPHGHGTALPDRVLRDPHLSWAAKGLLGHILGRPGGRFVTFAELAAEASGETEQDVRGYAAELDAAGYLAQLRDGTL